MEPALSMKQKDWCKSPAAKSVAAFDVSRMLFGDAPPRRECHEHRRSPHHHYLLSARQLRRHRRVGPDAWRRRLARHLAERSPPSRLRVAPSAEHISGKAKRIDGQRIAACRGNADPQTSIGKPSVWQMERGRLRRVSGRRRSRSHP